MIDKIHQFYRFNKKKINIILCITLIISLIIHAILRYNNIQTHGKYAVAYTTDSFYQKGSRKVISYEFYVKNKKYTGQISDGLFNRVGEVKAPGGHYLVLYYPKRPKNNILVSHKPVPPTINLDSLNMLGVDKRDFEWNDF